jgi:hypothetical protein
MRNEFLETAGFVFCFAFVVVSLIFIVFFFVEKQEFETFKREAIMRNYAHYENGKDNQIIFVWNKVK